MNKLGFSVVQSRPKWQRKNKQQLYNKKGLYQF